MNPTNLANTNDPLSIIRPAARRFGWILLAVSMLAVFLLSNFVFTGIASGYLNLYLLQPALWLAVACLALWLCSLEEERVNFFEQSPLIRIAAMIGAIQIAVSVIFGFLAGFGHSPYAHTLVMVTLNLWFVATRLVGIEVARWYLGKTVGRINAGLGYFIAWLLPLILLIPVGKMSLLVQPESSFRLVGGTLLPAASANLLAAYLVISAGPLASIAYLGVMQIFEWLSPILPDLPWMGTAFVGVLVPMISLIALNSQETTHTEEDAAETARISKTRDNSSAGSGLLVAVFAVGMIWLNSGALGVRPSLISGNSMNPILYPGDVVVTRVVSPEKIQVGDIIRFRRGDIDIVHRVMEVQSNGSTTIFTTRGDNNNVNDEPVMADQLEGKVILTLPKIGWIGIFFRMALNWAGGLF